MISGGKRSYLIRFIFADFTKNRLQILLLILKKNALKRINYYSSWNHQKKYGFSIISGEIR